MVAIRFIADDGAVRDVDATPGDSLMQAATAHRVPGIEAACGGAMVCGTCHVYVAPPWSGRLPPPELGEAMLLECGEHQHETSRLACQIRVSEAMEGAEVRTPPSQP